MEFSGALQRFFFFWMIKLEAASLEVEMKIKDLK